MCTKSFHVTDRLIGQLKATCLRKSFYYKRLQGSESINNRIMFYKVKREEEHEGYCI